MVSLGSAARFVVGTNCFNDSLMFFTVIYGAPVTKGKFKWNTDFAIFTDGRQEILLDETKDAPYGGIIYYTRNLEAVSTKLKELGYTLSSPPGAKIVKSAILQTSDNVLVNIVEASHPATPDPMKSDTKIDFGTFGEYAVSVTDLNRSVVEWENLGFSTYLKDEANQYAILSDKKVLLGLHSHDLSDHISLTYFDPEMATKIRKLQFIGIKFDRLNISSPSGKELAEATAHSPNGQCFYFFTGDVKAIK